MTDLMQAARKWWFGNVPGPFILPFHDITRKQVHERGGPSRDLDGCQACQLCEWVSRVNGRCEWVAHTCPDGTADLAHRLCLMQGDEGWTNRWQDFSFAEGADRNLGAPSVLMLQPPKGLMFLRSHGCDVSTINFLRQFGIACTYDVRADTEDVEWEKYDMVFVINGRLAYQGDQPPANLSTVMYGHDCYKELEQYQALIDAWPPDHFWCPNMASWRAGYRFPDKTRFWFRPDGDGTFFSRPNLGPEDKGWDLMVVGMAKATGPYAPRVRLADDAQSLEAEFKVRVETESGARFATWSGPTDQDGQKCLNAWSAHLGTARFAMFGPTTYQPNWVPRKAYELLGSGTVPIMPGSADFGYLGVEPWEHFIPLEEVRRPEALRALLSEYDRWQPIARAAVWWHRNKLDGLMFGGFEDMVQAATDGKYERRLTA